MSSVKSRYIWILIVLATAIISPVRGQTSVGSNIVSRTLLSSDGMSKINQLTGVSETAADYDVSDTFEYKRANGSQRITVTVLLIIFRESE